MTSQMTAEKMQVFEDVSSDRHEDHANGPPQHYLDDIIDMRKAFMSLCPGGTSVNKENFKPKLERRKAHLLNDTKRGSDDNINLQTVFDTMLKNGYDRTMQTREALVAFQAQEKEKVEKLKAEKKAEDEELKAEKKAANEERKKRKREDEALAEAHRAAKRAQAEEKKQKANEELVAAFRKQVIPEVVDVIRKEIDKKFEEHERNADKEQKANEELMAEFRKQVIHEVVDVIRKETDISNDFFLKTMQTIIDKKFEKLLSDLIELYSVRVVSR